MKTKIIGIPITGLLLLGLLAGCSKEQDPAVAPRPDNNYLAIEGEIVGASLATRAATDNLGSYRNFVVDDQIGFYSFHKPGCDLSWPEHMAQGDPAEYLQNVPLRYSDATRRKKFISTEIENVAMNTLGLTFAYFPYSAQTPPEGYVKQGNEGFVPMEEHDHYIHIFDENDQVRDLLTATKRQYTDVNYRFEHRFSMVLLFLGNGFDADDNGDLTVHLTERVIGAHLTRRWGSSPPPDMFEFTVDRVPLDYQTGIGHASFKAAKRGPYLLEGDTEPRIAYSVILPYGSQIDCIEVKDKNGRLQRVKAATLAQLESGWIYPATIRMSDGLEPTVYPHEILPWGDPERIEVNPLPGIYSADDFEVWLGIYNRHVDDFPAITDEDDFKALEQFGEYNEAEQHWTFYIRDNIDCSGITSTDGTLIKKLVAGVTIDGGRYKIERIMLDMKGAEPTAVGMGLFGEITGGSLRNLRLYFPTVRYQGQKPSGCLAAVISGGQIVNCMVREAAMQCRETAGTLAGRMSGGAVDDCKFHGMVQAAVPAGVEQKYLGILGAMPDPAGLIGTITNSVAFVEVESE